MTICGALSLKEKHEIEISVTQHLELFSFSLIQLACKEIARGSFTPKGQEGFLDVDAYVKSVEAVIV